MSTATTKLGLVKPDPTEDYSVAVFNANADKLDAATGAALVTSATRPSAPYPGQLIQESDTGNFLVRNQANTAWVTVANNGPWSSFTPVMTSTGTGFAEGSKTSWAGRWIRQGRTITYEFALTFGTGFAQGTGGTFEVSTPVSAVAPPAAVPGGLVIGTTWLWSGSNTSIAVARLKSASKLEFIHQGAVGGPIAGPGAPWAWAVAAQIVGMVKYEAAT